MLSSECNNRWWVSSLVRRFCFSYIILTMVVPFFKWKGSNEIPTLLSKVLKVEESSTINNRINASFMILLSFMHTCIWGDSKETFHGEARSWCSSWQSPLKVMWRSTWCTISLPRCVGCNENKQSKICKQAISTKDGEVLNIITCMLLILCIMMTVLSTLLSNVIINVRRYSYIKVYDSTVNAPSICSPHALSKDLH